MARFLKNRTKSHGASPGSLIFLGNKKMEKPEVYMMLYSKDSLTEKRIDDISDIPDLVLADSVMWINIYGLHDTSLIENMGQRFSIPPLEMEDILNPDQRPKLSENENNLNVFLKILEYKKESESISGDQISMVIGNNYLITFQEAVARYFEPVRERIRAGKTRIRQSGPDYLAYALIDTITDGYIQNIESLGSSIEDLEEEVFHNSKKETLQKIYRLKTNISFIRKNVWPLKEIMLAINKTESKLVHKKTFAFLKDLQDLLTQALEAVDIYYNMTNDYLNIYHANVGNRTNDVMKVLTIYASIFIPLTFIAGVYGTNFKYIPELEFKYSYPIMWGIMLIVAAIMLIFFKRKDWL